MSARPGTAASPGQLLRDLSASQWSVRLVGLGAVLVGSVVVTLGTGLPGAVICVFAVAAALWSVVAPSGPAPALAIVALCAGALPGAPPTSWWGWPVLASLVLLQHAAAALAAGAPPAAALPRPILTRWLARCAVVTAITVAGWLVAIGLSALRTGHNPLLVGVALALLLGTAIAIAYDNTRPG